MTDLDDEVIEGIRERVANYERDRSEHGVSLVWVKRCRWLLRALDEANSSLQSITDGKYIPLAAERDKLREQIEHERKLKDEIVIAYEDQIEALKQGCLRVRE